MQAMAFFSLHQFLLPRDSVTISLDSWSQERSIIVEWTPHTADVVLLYMEPFDSNATGKPTVVWLTRQTPRVTRIPLALTSAVFKAYGLKVWRDQTKFKVQSSCESEWIFHGAVSASLQLEPHRQERTVLNCFEPFDPFPCTVDKSGSLVERLPTLGMSPSTQTLLLCQQSSPFQEWVLLRGQPLHSLPDKNLEAVLPSRRRLSLRLLALRPRPHPDVFLLSSASAVMNVRAYLSKEDLQELKNRALDYRRRNGHQKVLLPYFFRNKPRHYFNNIFLTRGGLMEIYRKDANGDQDSAINNGNLFGLFFSAALDLYTHKPPTHSYFGDVRLLVAAPILFRNNSRLYFADFYCNNKAHYITLVLTKQGSEADQFCQKRLIELDPCNNPFLTREPAVPEFTRPTTSMSAYGGYYQYQSSMHDDPLSDLTGRFTRQLTLNYPHTSAGFYGFQEHQAASYQPFSQRTYSSMYHPAAPSLDAKVYTTLSRSLHIEVLYTEHVHMTKLQAKYGTENVSWGPCPTLGRGSSLPNGIPKKSSCTLCNLPRVD